ncbi:hypothetical protein OH76DRAFT_505946 [Lentinus brumalis]|uniref:Uncharacterized protein n=1 Tax=Lentinus brumalis TaxID=2498619 RepID=A0A371CHY5_9APHY|nr:hypothetical protein OH76DRAFT_505946 [Polyporus brumalis]
MMSRGYPRCGDLPGSSFCVGGLLWESVSTLSVHSCASCCCRTFGGKQSIQSLSTQDLGQPFEHNHVTIVSTTPTHL